MSSLCIRHAVVRSRPSLKRTTQTSSLMAETYTLTNIYNHPWQIRKRSTHVKARRDFFPTLKLCDPLQIVHNETESIVDCRKNTTFRTGLVKLTGFPLNKRLYKLAKSDDAACCKNKQAFASSGTAI